MQQAWNGGRGLVGSMCSLTFAIVLGVGATGTRAGTFTETESARAGATVRAEVVKWADWADWLEFMLLIHRLESVLADPQETPDNGDDTESGALANAVDQAGRFAAGGISASLSPNDAQKGLSDIYEIREVMLAHADKFTSSSWDAYFNTLNAMESELAP